MSNNTNINPELANILAGLSTQQQEALLANVRKLQQEQAPAAEVIDKPVEGEKAIVPSHEANQPAWLLSAIDRMTVLDRQVFCAMLLGEMNKAANAEHKQEIRKLIDDIRVNDQRWESRTVPFIVAHKKWSNTPAGDAARKAFFLGLKTREGTSAAVEWTGKQIQRLGAAIERNGDNVGKVVASPLMGLGKLISKSPVPKAANVVPTPPQPGKV